MTKENASYWREKLVRLEEWSMIAYTSIDTLSGRTPPTRRAVQRAVWLVLTFSSMDFRADRFEQNGKGGIRIESYSKETVWHIDSDGALSSVRPEGDGTRRFELAASVP
jgi:hypothetical protein